MKIYHCETLLKSKSSAKTCVLCCRRIPQYQKLPSTAITEVAAVRSSESDKSSVSGLVSGHAGNAVVGKIGFPTVEGIFPGLHQGIRANFKYVFGFETSQQETKEKELRSPKFPLAYMDSTAE